MPTFAPSFAPMVSSWESTLPEIWSFTASKPSSFEKSMSSCLFMLRPPCSLRGLGNLIVHGVGTEKRPSCGLCYQSPPAISRYHIKAGTVVTTLSQRPKNPRWIPKSRAWLPSDWRECSIEFTDALLCYLSRSPSEYHRYREPKRGGFMSNIDYGKLLGFQTVSDHLTGTINFKDETLGA